MEPKINVETADPMEPKINVETADPMEPKINVETADPMEPKINVEIADPMEINICFATPGKVYGWLKLNNCPNLNRKFRNNMRSIKMVQS